MFLFTSLAAHQATVLWYGLPEGLAVYGGYFQWYLDGSYVGNSTISANATACNGITISGLSGGTLYALMVHGYIYNADGSLTDIGTDSTTFSTPTRPAYFAWTVPKVSGAQFYVGAAEWSALMTNINEVTAYAIGSYPSWSYSAPSSGEILTAARYNDLRAAIQTVPGYGYYIPQVSSGQIVTAQQLNLLVSELNAIP